MILLVWIINIPIPPFPKRGCHFIQKSALGFVTEDMLPQTLAAGRLLLPQFLFVSSLRTNKNKSEDNTHCYLCVALKDLYLASDPKATMQPREPVDYRFYSLPLRLLHAVIGQASVLLLCPIWKKSWHPKQRCQEGSLHFNCKMSYHWEHLQEVVMLLSQTSWCNV